MSASKILHTVALCLESIEETTDVPFYRVEASSVIIYYIYYIAIGVIYINNTIYNESLSQSLSLQA